MWILVLGLVIFLGVHCVRVVASGFRQNQIDSRGAGVWKGIYAIASVIGLGLLIYGYGGARVSDSNFYFYTPPQWLTHGQILLMLPAMILMAASQGPTGRIKKAVRNPLLIATKLWAIGHLLVNGDLASWLLFGGFLAWAVVVVIDTKKREQTFPDKTSPAADIIPVLVGLGLWLAIVLWLHEWLIGVPVIA